MIMQPRDFLRLKEIDDLKTVPKFHEFLSLPLQKTATVKLQPRALEQQPLSTRDLQTCVARQMHNCLWEHVRDTKADIAIPSRW